MKNRNEGFTLIELLTSITILSIVFLVFFGFFGQGLSFSSTTENRQTAVHLAKETLQTVKTYENEIPDSFFSNDDSLQLSSIPSIRSHLLTTGCEGCVELNGTEFYPKVYPAETISSRDYTHLGMQPIYIIILDENGTELTFTYGYVNSGGVS